MTPQERRAIQLTKQYEMERARVLCSDTKVFILSPALLKAGEIPIFYVGA